MIKIFKSLFSHWINAGEILIGSLRLYTLILIPYLTISILCLIFSVLSGEFFNIIHFTRIYFYDGYFLYFIAWRVHLAWFLFCILINIDIFFRE